MQNPNLRSKMKENSLQRRNKRKIEILYFFFIFSFKFLILILFGRRKAGGVLAKPLLGPRPRPEDPRPAPEGPRPPTDCP